MTQKSSGNGPADLLIRISVLGTVYYDIATLDLMKRHRYTIHEKGKMRVNKTTGISDISP